MTFHQLCSPGPGMGGDYTGHGEPPDYKKAFEYFRGCQKNADGYHNLAALYKDGQGVEKNIPAAMMILPGCCRTASRTVDAGDALHSCQAWPSIWPRRCTWIESRCPPSTKPSHFSGPTSTMDQHHCKIITGDRCMSGCQICNRKVIPRWSSPSTAFCTHAVQFFRPSLRLQRAAYRMGVKSWIEGDIVEAEDV